MKRRSFIKEVVLLSAAPLLWLPRKASGQSLLILAGSPPAGTTPGWQDVATTAEADTTSGISSTDISWTPLVAAQSGSATKARTYIQTRYGAADLKMGLYDNSGNLISGADGTASSVGGAQYLEVTFGTPAAVTASTTYKLAWQSENINLEGRYLAGSGTYSFNASAYGSFPVASLPTDLGPLSRKWVASLWIE